MSRNNFLLFLFFHPVIPLFVKMFVSRSTIIDWFSENCIELRSIEELGRGVALIELVNVLFEGKITNYKNNPTNEAECIYNLQKVKVFLATTVNIKIWFPVERMAKCKMQDNLEFIQILYKKVHEIKNNGKRRDSVGVIMRGNSEKKERHVSNSRNDVSGVGSVSKEEDKLLTENSSFKQEETFESNNNSNKVEFIDNAKNEQDTTALLKELNELRYKLSNDNEIKRLNEETVKLQSSVSKYKEKTKEVISEMNYYYNKLCKVEKIVKEEMEESDVKNEIQKIFYSD